MANKVMKIRIWVKTTSYCLARFGGPFTKLTLVLGNGVLRFYIGEQGDDYQDLG